MRGSRSHDRDPPSTWGTPGIARIPGARPTAKRNEHSSPNVSEGRATTRPLFRKKSEGLLRMQQDPSQSKPRAGKNSCRRREK